ncbi:hypothetical protein D9613_006762 [Agrocybe pediades]|uniref:Uncharacterized protein n=1 Tax=Agrocybe pediades TaxID=84607 RepID=A0A8H4VHK8_9AGAR|nr:hypothetical protein D9613_006762 [Agrocybe pediades]
MIINDESSPTEQSPLKSPVIATAGGGSSSTPSAPPPPYTASATTRPSYQATQTPPGGPYPPTPSPVRSPFRRFFRAFCVALLILFLWGMFVDSVEMQWRGKKHRNSSIDPYNNMIGVDRYIRRWWYDTVLEVRRPEYPQAAEAPSRVLPLRYPPLISAAVSSASPVSSSTSTSIDGVLL